MGDIDIASVVARYHGLSSILPLTQGSRPHLKISTPKIALKACEGLDYLALRLVLTIANNLSSTDEYFPHSGAGETEDDAREQILGRRSTYRRVIQINRETISRETRLEFTARPAD